jgi:hypothetical protein
LFVFNFKNRTVFMFRATNSVLSPVVTCVFVDSSTLRFYVVVVWTNPPSEGWCLTPVVVCVMTEGACFFVVWALPGGGGGGGGEDNGPTTGARGHDYDAFGLSID